MQGTSISFCLDKLPFPQLRFSRQEVEGHWESLFSVAVVGNSKTFFRACNGSHWIQRGADCRRCWLYVLQHLYLYFKSFALTPPPQLASRFLRCFYGLQRRNCCCLRVRKHSFLGGHKCAVHAPFVCPGQNMWSLTVNDFIFARA